MKQTSKRIKLKDVTWTLNDAPCKTLKRQAGCWTDVTKKG